MLELCKKLLEGSPKLIWLYRLSVLLSVLVLSGANSWVIEAVKDVPGNGTVNVVQTWLPVITRIASGLLPVFGIVILLWFISRLINCLAKKGFGQQHITYEKGRYIDTDDIWSELHAFGNGMRSLMELLLLLAFSLLLFIELFSPGYITTLIASLLPERLPKETIDQLGVFASLLVPFFLFVYALARLPENMRNSVSLKKLVAIFVLGIIFCSLTFNWLLTFEKNTQIIILFMLYPYYVVFVETQVYKNRSIYKQIEDAMKDSAGKKQLEENRRTILVPDALE